jgi:hypothetical protein
VRTIALSREERGEAMERMMQFSYRGGERGKVEVIVAEFLGSRAGSGQRAGVLTISSKLVKK